jgi:hypothetical protein
MWIPTFAGMTERETAIAKAIGLDAATQPPWADDKAMPF